jgi:hypothetical protein
VILLENQSASLHRNNELLEDNNTKLSEQNDKMLNSTSRKFRGRILADVNRLTGDHDVVCF